MGPDDEPKGFLDEAFEHWQPTTETDGPGTAEEAAAEPIDPMAVVAPAVVIDAPPAAEPLERGELALIEEAAKKSGLIWVRTPTAPGGRSCWHVWHEGAFYVLTGGDEQPDPGLAGVSIVEVVVRSKESTARLASCLCAVEVVTSGSTAWESVTTDLAKTRLNLLESRTAAARWAADPTVRIYRLTPQGALLDHPGSYSSESQRAVPVPSAATTAGAPPKVIHRRHSTGRPLS